MKRCFFLLVIIAYLSMIATFSIIDVNGANYETPLEIEGYSYKDIEYLETQIKEKENLMLAAHDMAEAARRLRYDDTHTVIMLAKDEYQTYSNERDNLLAIHDELVAKWQAKRTEYPEATLIWECLKEAGYSDYVCAGILGNIMREVAGNDLNIQPLIKTSNYYGMCQWSLVYYPEVQGASIEEQCNFLANTIENEFKVFGKLYRRGFSYEDFLALTDARQAALAFAKCYERGGSSSYKARQNNAVIAYNYFVS